MKRLFTYSILFILAACEKGTENNAPPAPGSQTGQNSSTVCFKTTFINTTINDGSVSVFFLNEKDGFVTSYNGGIYKTTDSAKTWTKLNSGTTLPIRDIYFIDNNKGFAVGGLHSCGGTGCIPPGGFILRTLDGGQTWTKIYTPATMIEISSIYFTSATTGFCVGDNMIFKTIDGGVTWAATTLANVGGVMLKVSFADSQNGYIACAFDKIVKTTDGGATWTVTSPNKNVGYYSLSSSQGVTYVSGQGRILKTLNAGINWTELSNSPVDIYSIHFTDQNTGYAFGRGNYSGGDFGYTYGAMYCTNDGGYSWNGNGDFKDVGMIQSVSFPTKNIAYAVSGSKIIKISIQ
jgi:photosystem II stability/assembly factor-like uncharacterized protein